MSSTKTPMQSAIDGRILPAGVVDERAAVHRVEHLLVDLVRERRFLLQSLVCLELNARSSIGAEGYGGRVTPP